MGTLEKAARQKGIYFYGEAKKLVLVWFLLILQSHKRKRRRTSTKLSSKPCVGHCARSNLDFEVTPTALRSKFIPHYNPTFASIYSPGGKAMPAYGHCNCLYLFDKMPKRSTRVRLVKNDRVRSKRERGL